MIKWNWRKAELKSTSERPPSSTSKPRVSPPPARASLPSVDKKAVRHGRRDGHAGSNLQPADERHDMFHVAHVVELALVEERPSGAADLHRELQGVVPAVEVGDERLGDPAELGCVQAGRPRHVVF